VRRLLKLQLSFKVSPQTITLLQLQSSYIIKCLFLVHMLLSFCIPAATVNAQKTQKAMQMMFTSAINFFIQFVLVPVECV
jgi:hypothetical protein